MSDRMSDGPLDDAPPACPMEGLPVEYGALASGEQEQILHLQQAILESVARGGEARPIIDHVCLLHERLVPGAVASVMLIDHATQCLDVYAAPSVPPEGVARLAGLRPGPGGGSCGNAVFRKEPQYVQNTFTDPRWEDLRQLAHDFELRACWSMPIFAATGEVVGSFALSSFEHRAPDNFHRKLLQIGASIIGIVLERSRADEAVRSSRSLLRLIIDHAPARVFWKDHDSRYLGCNAVFARDAGLSHPDDVIGKTDGELVWRDQAELYRADDRRVMESGEAKLDFEEPQTTHDGRTIWLNTSKVPLRDLEGAVFGVLGMYWDATDRKMAEDELRIAAATFQSQEGIIVTDAEGTIIRVNAAFEAITGYGAGDVIGKNPRILKSGLHDRGFYRAMWTALLKTGKWSGELWDKRKNGEAYPKSMTITAIADEKGRLSHYVAVFTDISERKQSEEAIHRLAFYDPLTQLPNRRLLLEQLHQLMAAGARSGRYGALLMLDMDHFKTINDTLGHVLGDHLLVEVAHRLKSCVRDGDVVARLGGDEYVVVLDGLSAQMEEAGATAGKIAEKIRAELARPYLLKGYECHSSPSIGVSLFRGQLESIEELLKQADMALYQAKASGRNAASFFDPSMQAVLEQRSSLVSDLRQALRQQQFRLHYQVQVDQYGRPMGAEALLRWEHPERGLVFPGEFIPPAEEAGLIVPIGLWALEEACAQLRDWGNDPLARGWSLAVNVSARQFRQPGFIDDVQRVLKDSGADPRRLKLELTESAVLDDVEDSIHKMWALKAWGVEFSMDDFGTGYSSLSNLKRLPLDQIKIDRSFVQDIPTDPNDAAIVNTIIAMSRTLGLAVIAEGVETEEQRDFLERHGCQAFQGYLFGKPVPLSEFEARARELGVSASPMS